MCVCVCVCMCVYVFCCVVAYACADWTVQDSQFLLVVCYCWAPLSVGLCLAPLFIAGSFVVRTLDDDEAGAELTPLALVVSEADGSHIMRYAQLVLRSEPLEPPVRIRCARASTTHRCRMHASDVCILRRVPHEHVVAPRVRVCMLLLL